MAFFKFGKKKQEEQTKMTTLEEVRKAYEDLSDEDKKAFHQSIADSVHESVAAQERAEGEEDSQSAEAREHEALGAEHAEDKGEVEELGESDETAEEETEDKEDKYAAILARLEAIEKRLAEPEENSDETADEATAKKAQKVYGVGNGVFAAAHNDEKITPQEAAEIARKLKF